MTWTWMKIDYSWCILYADHESELENAEIFDPLRNFICNKFCNNPGTVIYIIRVAELIGNKSS